MDNQELKLLTLKQRTFVKSYVETGNGTKSALIAYNCKSPQSADAMARETLGSPRVQKAVHLLMKEKGLDDEVLLEKHAELLNHPNPVIQLRSLDLAHKLAGNYKAPSQEMEPTVRVEIQERELPPEIKLVDLIAVAKLMLKTQEYPLGCSSNDVQEFIDLSEQNLRNEITNKDNQDPFRMGLKKALEMAQVLIGDGIRSIKKMQRLNLEQSLKEDL